MSSVFTPSSFCPFCGTEENPFEQGFYFRNSQKFRTELRALNTVSVSIADEIAHHKASTRFGFSSCLMRYVYHVLTALLLLLFSVPFTSSMSSSSTSSAGIWSIGLSSFTSL